jgi:hypothetical protein
MAIFSEIGEPEKTAISHLHEQFGKLDTKLAEIKAFSSAEEYLRADLELVEAFRSGDLDKIKELLTSLDLKRLPFSEGYNHES